VRPVAVALLAACTAAAPPPFRVDRGFIRDADGRAVILRGVNISAKNKRPPYLDFQGPDDFRRVRADWGFDAVRFVVPWASIEPTSGGYDDGQLAALRLRMAWAAAADLLVVVDLHQDLYGEGFGGDGAPTWACDGYDGFKPRTPWFFGYLDARVEACFDRLWTDATLQGHVVGVWSRIAQALAAEPAVIGFDIINEPFWGTADVVSFEPERLQPFYETVGAAVRAVAPGWLAFIEPSVAAEIGIGPGTQLTPLRLGGVVYAPHAYDAQAESGAGFDPARAPDLVNHVADLAGEARGLGAPLVLGEYGGDASRPGIGAYMDAAYAAAGAVAAGSMYWDYSMDDSYGLLDASGAEKPELLAALVRPYPERVAGTPIDWAFAGGVFTLRYHPDPAVTAPTIISLPARAAEGGADVACGGCAYAVAGGRVTVTSPPAGDPAVIVVTARPRPGAARR
jgi:endoglycosylceramidase